MDSFENLSLEIPVQASLEIPRGVSPQILLHQVQTTMPYYRDLNSSFLKTLQNFNPSENTFLDHADYFKLCVTAHFATCGSFVPTDVDNQIRFRLWNPQLPDDQVFQMVETVFEARSWDVSQVTTRVLPVPTYKELLTGHKGEWLTIASAAYGALRKRSTEKKLEVLGAIQEEVEFEIAAYNQFKKIGDGISLLKASALIAHNIGDLRRVVEMWNLEAGDPLFDFSLNCMPLEISELYKAIMAPECHRFFALRAAKCLRQSPDFLVPIGPFFDDWGKLIARHPLLEITDVAKVIETLIDGFFKINNSIGYARALVGIETHYPGGLNTLGKELPSRIEKAWKTGPLRQLCTVSKEKFEAQWATKALKFVREFRG